MGEKMIARMLAGAAVAAAAMVAKKALDGSWRVATGGRPPTDPEDPDVAWKEAVAWALLSGAVIGMAQLAAARGAHKFLRNRRAVRA